MKGNKVMGKTRMSVTQTPLQSIPVGYFVRNVTFPHSVCGTKNRLGSSLSLFTLLSQ